MATCLRNNKASRLAPMPNIQLTPSAATSDGRVARAVALRSAPDCTSAGLPGSLGARARDRLQPLAAQAAAIHVGWGKHARSSEVKLQKGAGGRCSCSERCILGVSV